MQVADCYIHVRYPRLRREEFDDLRKRLFSVATEAAINVKRGQEIDYTFEEGTLFQRIVVIGGIFLGAVTQYHNFRTSVIDIAHDAETFSDYAIEKFHHLTGTSRADVVYTRTSSRDLNRLRRIIDSFDRIAEGDVKHSDLSQMRTQVIHDLAGLARANPDDPDIAKVFRLLPKDRLPHLPDIPPEAILADEAASRRKGPPSRQQIEGPPLAGRIPEPGPGRPPRRFHARLPINRGR